ncbi:MAG: DUF4382 domain-containing protein [Clostridiales bacterium]|nr:DUF4382 domain-containing protein [Clostridiales bacterium]MCF8022921.1 DUF4382 domain-containing protein [Clostridiales bacterium]
MKKLYLSVLALTFFLAVVSGCSSGENSQQDKEQTSKQVEQKEQTGTLHFKANGEDFVRQGFTSKDGWDIAFEHVYVNLAAVTGYQSEPAYKAEDGGKIQPKNKVALSEAHVVDLAKGSENADPILVGQVEDVPVGHYNAISWKMVHAETGPSKGYSLAVTGEAVKDGKTVNFTIKDGTEYKYTGGEYIGDERKGFVKEGEKAELEMTFHFDHVFGDAGAPADGGLNAAAPGFDPFAEAAENGTLNASISELEDKMCSEDYKMLKNVLPTLGHVGEGHCHVEVL